jgi:hypothetical protein
MNVVTLRKLLSLSLSALATLAASTALAEPLDLAALPAGKPSIPPKREQAPRFIPGNKTAEGLQRVSPQRFQPRGMPGYTEYAIFDDEARARSYETELKGGTAMTFARSDTCFATSGTFRVPEEHDPRPLDWDTFSADRFTGQSYPGDGASKVVPVRAERWIETGGQVHVKTTEFWLDLRSGGTKLIASSEQELRRVAVPFDGVSVFALRTGADSAAFFVRRELPKNPASPSGEALTIFGGVPLGGSRGDTLDLSQLRTSVEGDVHTSACAFERVDLQVRTDPARDFGLATHPGKQLKVPRSRKGFNPFAGSRRPAESVNVFFATVVGLDPEPAPASGAENSRMFFGGRNGTAEVRAMVVNLGLARSTSGGAPVPSVSYRWLDRPRTIAF